MQEDPPRPSARAGGVLLRRDYLSAVENVAQSIGTMGPVATIGTVLPLLMVKTGNATWLLVLCVLAAFYADLCERERLRIADRVGGLALGLRARGPWAVAGSPHGLVVRRGDGVRRNELRRLLRLLRLDGRGAFHPIPDRRIGHGRDHGARRPCGVVAGPPRHQALDEDDAGRRVLLGPLDRRHPGRRDAQGTPLGRPGADSARGSELRAIPARPRAGLHDSRGIRERHRPGRGGKGGDDDPAPRPPLLRPADRRPLHRLRLLPHARSPTAETSRWTRPTPRWT